jgi:redox-sensing transcriptional repressor
VKNFTDKPALPPPTLERLSRLYTLLCRLGEGKDIFRVTSRTLGELLSVPDHTIRKDISLLAAGGGTEGVSGGIPAAAKDIQERTEPETIPGRSGVQGYDIAELRELVGGRLGLRKGFLTCLVGLGRLGGAILYRSALEADRRYSLAAAFDASVNRIELTRTDVPLYHSAEISRVVREKGIVAGIIAVPPEAAADVGGRLIAGGVRGIVNFAPVIIPAGNSGVVIRNVSLTGELDMIAAYINNIQGVQGDE